MNILNSIINKFKTKEVKADKILNEKLNELLYKEEFNGEKDANKILLVVLLLFLILLITNLFFTNSFFRSNTFANFLGLLILLFYHSILFIILNLNIYNKVIKYITVTINITSLSILLAGYSINTGWVHSLRTFTIVVYYFAIVLSGLYKRPQVSIFAGVITAFQYSLLFLYAVIIKKTPVTRVETFQEYKLSYDLLLYFPASFIFLSLVVAYISRNLKRLLERSIYSEADAYAKQKSKEALEEASKQKINFFINLAHETKTPLTLIMNYLDSYIKKHGISEELRIIKNSIGKLTRDMVNFLDVEKLQRGQVFYNHDQVINLKNMLEDKLIMFSEISKRKDIYFVYETINEDVFLKIDPFAMDRIVNNIIDNAIRYTTAGGSVYVTVELDNDNIKFIVKDTGIGMSEDQKNHIFDQFYQISHQKRNIQGIGMGLNIVKNIIDKIGGKIDIMSKPSEGTVFTITLKQYFPDEKDKIVKNLKYSNAIDNFDEIHLKDGEYIRNRPNILIVDDNKEMLYYLIENLSDIFNAFFAINGKEALLKIEVIPTPDLILSDVMMDVMGGYEFFERFTENDKYKSIPFLFITAKDSKSEKIQGLEKGAVDFISKPFMIEELRAKINSIIQIHKQLKIKHTQEMKKKLSRLVFNDETGTKEKKYIHFESRCKYYNITSREKEIIVLLMTGMEYKEIGVKLNITINTVKKYIKKIYSKCDIQNKVELINLFRQ